ncbi:MAG: UDP-N-acetylglucosamine 1-carboxyvinyltransferase [Candidatus Portnoybacteria bacterium]|nr:UDP-N-acetylglucosamine 1-carboxyvinyltransferase [Candidatus Portnoybacteria bacterium]
MSKFVIRGGKPLTGTIKVGGSKNAALKALPLALMTKELIVVKNLPEIEDVFRAEEMLGALGHEVKNRGKGVAGVRQKNNDGTTLPAELVNKFRASIMFVGPLLATRGEARFPHPGGCVIGAGIRPIDLFLDGFEKMGAVLETEDNYYRLTAKKLKGATIFFPTVTVTGTESLMMTACLAGGATILKNCAMEPEISALADFLNSIGAKIEGAGTSTIMIKGVRKLGGGEYEIIPDRIEAGTFAMMAAAASNSGGILINDCEPAHLEALWTQFDKAGVNYKLGKNSIKISPSKKIKACGVKTHEYPGFATDLQSPYTVLMTQAEGISLIHEVIYDRRLLFSDLLTQMGANIIMADPHRVVIEGPTRLFGKKLVSPDLRAGVALVIAALIAEGKTEIDNIYQIERGYENLDGRLRELGADIQRVNV